MRTRLMAGVALAALSLASLAHAGHGSSLTLNGIVAGPTPFIAKLDMTVSPPDGLKGITFSIAPKTGSVTRPITCDYSARYLAARGFLDTTSGHLMLPVFGLYQAYANAVGLRVDFAQGPSQDQTVVVPTPAWSDPTGGAYLNPAILQARTASTSLSYDYIMLKGFAAGITPILIDTDGQVRWIGTSGIASISSILFDNGIYVSNGTGLTRMELDGAFSAISNYSGMGVTSTGHHNYDYGKDGILVEVNEGSAIECRILEVDGNGSVLRTWNLDDIIRNAMIAGGDDPSALVRSGADWFHNNAATYDKHGNLLIVSGREDFVIALDYDTGAIRWILGDPTKAWYQYPSLQKYALTLLGDSLPPIGQHAVSVTDDRDLLLFDDGRASLNQNPIGTDRNYSAPRKYRIRENKMTAMEVWNYLASPSLYSPYCSSVYEDDKSNYLIDYTLAGDVIAFEASGAMTFHYKYSTANFCGISWNAFPIHLENLQYK